MGKSKKLQTIGRYTCLSKEGTVTITVPSNIRLPLHINLHVKGDKKKSHFILVSQRVKKVD